MVQRQSVSYALKLCILESEVPEVFCGRTTTRRSFLLGKFPMIQGMKISEFWHGMNYIYIILRGSTPNSLFSLWKRPLQRKKTANGSWENPSPPSTPPGHNPRCHPVDGEGIWTPNKYAVLICLKHQNLRRYFESLGTLLKSKHLKDFRFFFMPGKFQGFSQLCAGKQTCPTRQCPSPRHVYTCKHVPPAAARLFRMLPLVPFNGRQTMINCTCIQLVIKHSNIKTPK